MAEPDKKTDLKLLESLNMVWEIVIMIALPTTLAALAGRWLDNHLHSSPWFTILGLVVALALAYLLVSRKAKDVAKRLGGPKA